MDEYRRSSANGGDSETYNKVHHDLDVAAEHRKPIVTEHKYKVNVAEPGVETLPLADHDDVSSRKSEKSSTVTKTSTSSSTTAAAEKKSKAATTAEKPKPKPATTTGESQKGQFIAKPDVYGEDDDESGGGGFPWGPVLAGAAAIAGTIAGAMFYRKRNPDVDVKLRRSVEDADHRVKGALGSGERKVKDIIGSGQQKFNSLLHRGEHHDASDDDSSHGSHSRGHGIFGGSSSGDYQVKQGDNLTKIAKKSGKKSWHEIAEKNPSLRNPDLIYPGEKLNL